MRENKQREMLGENEERQSDEKESRDRRENNII